MDDPLAQLETEYCPPLDSALLSAIVSDYDLSTGEGLATARATLDLLKESAQIEEAAGFDPSGTGGYDKPTSPYELNESCTENGASQSRETDATSLSNGLSSLELEDREKLAKHVDTENIGKAEDLDALDEDVKIMLLQELFGDHASRYSIQHTLRKCNGKWNTAMEELLNHVYIGEAEDSEDGGKLKTKGVEGFSEDKVIRRGRKTKAKGQKLRALEERRAASMPTSPVDTQSPANKWQTAKEDVDFIATRTGLEVLIVKSTYNEQNANVPKTINALIKQTMEETKKVVTDDDLVQTNARDLGRDFPTISPHYLAALIRLTHPSTANAHELAKALSAKPKEPSTSGGIQVIPMYARPTQADIEPASRPRQARSAGTSAFPPSSSLASPEDPTAALRGNAYAAARAQAFAQARAAHRRAGSDRLMGGAAAYYSQVGRDLSALSFGASADAADALAARQSSATQCDLHGIDVLNGVRIAQERVEEWWGRLGESKVNGRAGAGERGEGYRIVVGSGTHSAGGKGKLGPAVLRHLRGEGWRVESAGAVVVVRGKVGR